MDNLLLDRYLTVISYRHNALLRKLAYFLEVVFYLYEKTFAPVKFLLFSGKGCKGK